MGLTPLTSHVDNVSVTLAKPFTRKLSTADPPSFSTPIPEVTEPWCAVTTRHNCEKALANHLARLGIDYFLPYVHNTYRPLFSGVLFMARTYPSPPPPIHPEMVRGQDFKLCMHGCSFSTVIRLARESRYVRDTLHTLNQPRLKQELTLLACADDLRAEPHRPKSGDRVVVTAGQWKGFEGTVKSTPQRQHGMTRFYVELQFMGTRVSYPIESKLLQRL